MDDTYNWIFPERIEFINVSDYMQKFEQHCSASQLTLDLRKTEHIHASFIGFLIHAKNYFLHNGGSFTLLPSFTVEKLFAMLNLLEYFSLEMNSAASIEKISA